MIKVIWSHTALQEFDQLLEFWIEKNKSNSYSDKIVVATDDAIDLIKNHNGIGINTDHRNVQMRLVLNRYYFVYLSSKKTIEILKFWDCRQHPRTNPFLICFQFKKLVF